MPRGGHNIKSAKEKATQGTSRRDRDAGRLENYAETLNRPPTAPAHFDARHKKKWKSVCAQMIRAGTLTASDLDAIACYVENWFMSANAFQSIVDDGPTIWVETKNGKKPVTNPAFRQYQDSQKILHALMNQFGFTPKARMGIKIADKPKTESKILKLLSGPNKKTGTSD